MSTAEKIKAMQHGLALISARFASCCSGGTNILTSYTWLLHDYTWWACPPTAWDNPTDGELADHQMAYDGWCPLDNTAVL